MARTRRQITLQEQESGVPASPPRSLPNAIRSTRAKRRASRNNTTAPPADPLADPPADPPTDHPPSKRGGPTVRGSRISRAKKVGRGRVQQQATSSHHATQSLAMDVDTTEVSDSSTQPEVASHASPEIRTALGDDEKLEDMEEADVEPPGETQFPISVSAHPVQVQDINAHPVQGYIAPQEPHESATSLKFREILQGNLRSPGPSPGPRTPTTISPIVPLSSPSETSSEAATPTRVASISSCPSLEPVPQAPSPSSEPTIYYVPSDPERSHSLVTVHMDHIQGSKDPVRPSKPAAFVVPSELIAPICRYIESRARPGSDLSKLTTDHPAVNAFVHGDARYRPKLPSWQSQESSPARGSTMRDAFVRRSQRKRGYREMEDETAAVMAENAKLRAIATEASHLNTPQTKDDEAPQSIDLPPKRTKTVPDPYTDDGQLVLGRTKEIEVDEYGIAVNPTDDTTLRWSDMETRKRAQLEEARRVANIVEYPYVAEEDPHTDGPALGGLLAESQDQVQPEQVPETPRARGWGLSSFLPSAARSVAKYIPFSSRRAISTPQSQPSASQPPLAQTEPPVNASSSQSQSNLDVAESVAGSSHRHRHHQSTSNQQRLLTKEQSEEEKRIKKMRAQLRRDAEALAKEKKEFEIAKKASAEQQQSAVAAQTPGQKRKRLPSPDVIPLPANGGFGLVDEYFIVDSSSDEDVAAAQETPTKDRPLKKARTSAPDDATVDSPFRARPYRGTLFAHPDALRSRQDDNLFVESDGHDGHDGHRALDSTPPPGPTITFRVPSPGSSDSDDDEDDEQERVNETSQEASSPSVPETRSILRNSPLHSSQSQSRPTTNSASQPKTMAPPPRPNLGHATSPAPTAMTTSDALEKARERALRHQPKQPSTLRESSRLSSSSVNSDVVDEGNVEEYDPAHPAIVSTPSKVPVLGQSATPVAPALGQADISTAPTGSQQIVSQAVSERLHEQQAVSDDSGKQAEPVKKQNEVLPDAEQSNANRKAEIKADLDRYWEEHGDDYFLDEGYEEFEEEMLAEEQKLMDGPNGMPYKQPQNIISPAFDRVGAHSHSLADRDLQAHVEYNWRPGDLERTESNPAHGMKVFFDRMVKSGDIDREMADMVIALGVPPGITEYLAGQGAMGPVAV